MFKEYFMLLLLAHVLGDFYFQTDSVARKKDENLSWVLIHSVCYWITVLLVMVSMFSFRIFIMSTIVAVLHGIVDAAKFYYVIRQKKKGTMTLGKERSVFFVDQSIHLISLLIFSYLLAVGNTHTYLNDGIVNIFDVIGLPLMTCVCWFLVLLIVHKPANIAISKLLALYRPENNDEKSQKSNNAGRFIGTMERITILIFISIGQFSAIGLVLTAKSIARYDRITKVKDFAEYYLLGTLLSTAIAIMVSFLL